ncbi:H-type lectin [Gracilaria domingensis]|nr:H-type lectin [Gracilaria domingensis]
MSVVTVHVHIYLSEAQNDSGSSAEYQSEVTLINRSTKEKAESWKYSKVKDNRKYDPPLLLQNATHKVYYEKGQKVVAILKMFEDDTGTAGDAMTEGDDICFNDTYEYDPSAQEPYVKKNWKGVYDKGYYTVQFVPPSVKKIVPASDNHTREQPAGGNTVQASMANSVWDVNHDNLVQIVFEKPICPAPTIVCSLQGFDIDAPRLKIEQGNVSSTSCAIRLQTWSNSILYNMWCGWLPIHTSPTLQTGSWSTHDVRDWTDNNRTKTIGQIQFATAFKTTPRVVAMLNGFDSCRHRVIRIELEVANVSKDGFTIVVSKWGNTHLSSADVTWVATTEDSSKVAMGYWDSRSVRSWRNAVKRTSCGVEFKPKFACTPRVLTGYARLDAGKGKEVFRSHCIPSDISESGFTANVATWGDSIVYAGKIAYVAMIA